MNMSFKVTKNEEKLLKALKTHFTVKQAAGTIGFSTTQAYNILYRIRKKRANAQSYVNIVNNYCKSSNLIDKVLSYKVSVRNPVLLETTEE